MADIDESIFIEESSTAVKSSTISIDRCVPESQVILNHTPAQVSTSLIWYEKRATRKKMEESQRWGERNLTTRQITPVFVVVRRKGWQRCCNYSSLIRVIKPANLSRLYLIFFFIFRSKNNHRTFAIRFSRAYAVSLIFLNLSLHTFLFHFLPATKLCVCVFLGLYKNVNCIYYADTKIIPYIRRAHHAACENWEVKELTIHVNCRTECG